MTKLQKISLLVLSLTILTVASLFLTKTINFNQINKFIPFSTTTTSEISPDILSLTNPIHNLTGIIEKIDGNQITFSWVPNNPSSPIPPQINQTSPIPSPKTEKVTYTVTITPKTTITTTMVYIPYVTKQPTTLSFQTSTKDLKPGVTVTITSINDLRKVTNYHFDASTIALAQPLEAIIKGKIDSIDDKTITLKARPFFGNTISQTGNSSEERDYQVVIDKETEIVMKSSPLSFEQSSKPKSLLITDLSKNQTAIVYIDVNSETKPQKALKIDIEPKPSSVPPNISLSTKETSLSGKQPSPTISTSSAIP